MSIEDLKINITSTDVELELAERWGTLQNITRYNYIIKIVSHRNNILNEKTKDIIQIKVKKRYFIDIKYKVF